MNPSSRHLRKASPEDIPKLVALLQEFYAEADYKPNVQHAAEAFTAPLADEGLGHAYPGRN
jgi:hypothetical protein